MTVSSLSTCEGMLLMQGFCEEQSSAYGGLLLFLPFAKELMGVQLLSCSSSTRNHHISRQIKPLTGMTWRVKLQL